jgi:hypothetical protein
MTMYSIRTERAFSERHNHDLSSQRIHYMRIDEPGFDATTLSKNRRHMLDHEVAMSSSRRWSAMRRCTTTSLRNTSPSTAHG